MSADLSKWTLVFDLDGTLVETAPDLHAALNHTLASKDLGPIPLSEIRMMIGDGAKALIRKGLQTHNRPVDEIEIDQSLWPLFIEHYLENITRLSHVYEGALEALDHFKQTGATLAVCTNKAQHLAEQVLQSLSLDAYFSATIGGDKASTQKPDGAHILETIALANGDTDRAIMIGDSQTDERAARNAKLPFVFVTFGYGLLSDNLNSNVRAINHWDQMSRSIAEITSRY